MEIHSFCLERASETRSLPQFSVVFVVDSRIAARYEFECVSEFTALHLAVTEFERQTRKDPE